VSDESFEKISEPRAQVQSRALAFDKASGIGGGLHGVAQVGHPHQFDGVTNVCVGAHPKRGPSGVWHPAMLFGLTFLDQRVAKRTRKWYVERPVRVQVADLSLAESEFLACKSVWMNRNTRPGGDFLLKIGQVIHSLGFQHDWMSIRLKPTR
jgi:hypothetical protein